MPRGAIGTSAHSWTESRSVFLFRGQVLPADSLLNIVDVELIYGGIKYILKVKACASQTGVCFISSVNLEWGLHAGL